MTWRMLTPGAGVSDSRMRSLLLAVALTLAACGEDPVKPAPRPGEIFACTSVCVVDGARAACLVSVLPCDGGWSSTPVKRPSGCDEAESRWVAPRALPVCPD